MPLKLPQSMKSLSSIKAQPQEVTTKMEAIICMDLAGKGTVDIANELGMTPGRISVIKSSPLYQQQREVEKGKLREMFRDKQTDRLLTDPVEELLKKSALEAARTKVELMTNGKSEFVKLAASGDILDRAGYKAHQEKTIVSVTVTEKMADRFERALKFNPIDMKITKEISNE